jgi:hypothetical protein
MPQASAASSIAASRSLGRRRGNRDRPARPAIWIRGADGGDVGVGKEGWAVSTDHHHELDHHFDEPTAIRTNLDAIFVSLELSRSTWLVTSVSPGGGEKMSKHSVSAGNVAALLTRLSELKQKALRGSANPFMSSPSRRMGWMGFGFIECCGWGIPRHTQTTCRYYDNARLPKALYQAPRRALLSC